ncbi:MAG: Maf family protein [Desulfobulbaceae bacterium]|nr:Maf family protein [Desulfobulbaceae bacterium]
MVDEKSMFVGRHSMLLASASPRRRRFLEQLGLHFDVEPAEVNEDAFVGENPQAFVLRLALDKARVIAQKRVDSVVVAADTAVVLGDAILGKPQDPAAAVDMLMQLAGRTHLVWTGYAVVGIEAKIELARAVCTEVRFVDFDRQTAAAYVATGEPLDKAGSYGIQGRGGCLVEGIVGSWSNVVGLPMAELVADLRSLGIIEPTE